MAKISRKTAEYEAVKKRLSTTAANLTGYNSGKNTIILRILASAGLTEGERSALEANQR